MSTGPAIRVMLRGCAGLPSSAIIATAASAGTQGWQIADDMRARADHARGSGSGDRRNRRGRTPPCGQRHVARIVPIGDVDIVVGQQRPHRVAQQGREMTGHRRDQQDARLRRVDVSCLKCSSVQNGVLRGRPLRATATSAVADPMTRVDAESRPAMGQPGAARISHAAANLRRPRQLRPAGASARQAAPRAASAQARSGAISIGIAPDRSDRSCSAPRLADGGAGPVTRSAMQYAHHDAEPVCKAWRHALG